MAESRNKQVSEFRKLFTKKVDKNWPTCAIDYPPGGKCVLVLSKDLSVTFSDGDTIINFGGIISGHGKDVEMSVLVNIIEIFLLQDKAYQTYLNNKKLDELLNKTQKFHSLIYDEIQFAPGGKKAEEAQKRYNELSPKPNV